MDRKCLDPFCPCQDGDSCHYETVGDTKASPILPEYMIPGKVYECVWTQKDIESWSNSDAS